MTIYSHKKDTLQQLVILNATNLSFNYVRAEQLKRLCARGFVMYILDH
jgi:hypothetical protein